MWQNEFALPYGIPSGLHAIIANAVDENGRANVALRIKAALWLRGRPGNKGTREDPVVSMTTSELAEHQLLVQNDISRSKLDEILRLRREPRPMELRVIAEALELPEPFLLGEEPFAEPPGEGGDRRQELAEALETIKLLAERLQSER